MNALLSPSREKAAEGNVRAALWLSSPRWAKPPGAEGARTGQPHGGHQSQKTHLALRNHQFTVHVETKSLCMCLVQVVALALQPKRSKHEGTLDKVILTSPAGLSQVLCTNLLR